MIVCKSCKNVCDMDKSACDLHERGEKPKKSMDELMHDAIERIRDSLRGGEVWVPANPTITWDVASPWGTPLITPLEANENDMSSQWVTYDQILSNSTGSEDE